MALLPLLAGVLSYAGLTVVQRVSSIRDSGGGLVLVKALVSVFVLVLVFVLV